MLCQHQYSWCTGALCINRCSLIAKFLGQHGTHLGPTKPRWAPCWHQELCYLRIVLIISMSYCNLRLNHWYRTKHPYLLRYRISTTCGISVWRMKYGIYLSVSLNDSTRIGSQVWIKCLSTRYLRFENVLRGVRKWVIARDIWLLIERLL